MYLTDILAHCSHIESRVARLYRALADRFHNDASTAKLWRELALEEETHADILRRELRSFDDEDDSGPFLPDYEARIDHVKGMLTELEGRVRELATLDDAMAFAVAIEQTEIEDLFDDLVTQGYPAFKLISERIEASINARPAETIPGLPHRSGTNGAKTPPR